MYGIEVILSIEIEILSLRIAKKHHLDIIQSVKDRLEYLKALSELRRMASLHVEVVQRR